MEKNLDSKEFSTSIEELLQEDEVHDTTTMSHKKSTDYESESDEEVDNDLDVPPKNLKLLMKDLDPTTAKKTSKQWVREWLFDMKRDMVSKLAILAALFVLFTNPFFVKILHEYLPFCFATGSIGYNGIGSFLLSAIFSVIYAFLALE